MDHITNMSFIEQHDATKCLLVLTEEQLLSHHLDSAA